MDIDTFSKKILLDCETYILQNSTCDSDDLTNYISKLKTEIELNIDTTFQNPLLEKFISELDIHGNYHLDYIDYLYNSSISSQKIIFRISDILPIILYVIKNLQTKEDKIILNTDIKYHKTILEDYQETNYRDYKNTTCSLDYSFEPNESDLNKVSKMLKKLIKENGHNELLCNYLEKAIYYTTTFENGKPLFELTNNKLSGLVADIFPLENIDILDIPYLYVKTKDEIYGTMNNDIYMKLDYTQCKLNIDPKIFDYKKSLLESLENLSKYNKKEHINDSMFFKMTYNMIENYDSTIINYIDDIIEIFGKNKTIKLILHTYNSNLYYNLIETLHQEGEDRINTLKSIIIFLIHNTSNKYQIKNLPTHDFIIGKIIINNLLEKYEYESLDIEELLLNSLFEEMIYKTINRITKTSSIYVLMNYLLNDTIEEYDIPTLKSQYDMLKMVDQEISFSSLKYKVNKYLEELNLTIRIIDEYTIGDVNGELSKDVKLFLEYFKAFHKDEKLFGVSFWGGKKVSQKIWQEGMKLQINDLEDLMRNFESIYNFIKYNSINNEFEECIIHSYNPRIYNEYLKLSESTSRFNNKVDEIMFKNNKSFEILYRILNDDRIDNDVKTILLQTTKKYFTYDSIISRLTNSIKITYEKQDQSLFNSTLNIATLIMRLFETFTKNKFKKMLEIGKTK
ncbi:MAG: hypothetical protein CMF62_04200 [Magnetococcales bacterium]|nr:hypothetical protein [Magnetococcales bacterium]|tara:strand:+ start:147 stop:2189 length:2043 start_codon:yes stop_codon:yes gene_type:complete